MSQSSVQSRQGRVALFVIAAGVGAFFILSYFGIFDWPPLRPGRRRAIFSDPHHWQILSIGIAFVCAGVAFIIPRGWTVIGKACSLLLLVSLLAGILGAFLAR